MSAERKTDVPPFEVGGVVFTCFTLVEVDGTPMVWRSGCKRLAVGRMIKLRMVRDDDGREVERAFAEYWARLDGVLLKSDYGSLKTAMIMASMALCSASGASTRYGHDSREAAA